MKKTLTIIMMFALCIGASAQTSTTANKKFLKRCEALVTRIDDRYAQNADSVAAWKAERKNIQTLYKERYKSAFSDDELEEYSKITTQYKTKMTDLKLDNLGEKLDTIGSKMSRSMKRTGKKVSGFFKGLKAQSDSNRMNN